MFAAVNVIFLKLEHCLWGDICYIFTFHKQNGFSNMGQIKSL